MYTESEIDVKQIELEICSAAKTGAFALVVGPLLFVTQTQTEHTERHIEAVSYKNLTLPPTTRV